MPESYSRSVRVAQLQLEQDSGRSLHDEQRGLSLIDLNRAGAPLMEIVFAPDLFDGEEAAALIKELSLILLVGVASELAMLENLSIIPLKRLGTCSCRMEEGALRVDANVSVRRASDDALGTRTEVKNLNSIRSVCKAVEHEVERQIALIEAGGEVVNETRSFDADQKVTVAMRQKESKVDYRFMPEPNLPPLRLDEQDIDRWSRSLPELPADNRAKMVSELSLSLEIASRIVNEPGLHGFFVDAIQPLERDTIDKVRSVN